MPSPKDVVTKSTFIIMAYLVGVPIVSFAFGLFEDSFGQGIASHMGSFTGTLYKLLGTCFPLTHDRSICKRSLYCSLRHLS